MTNSEDIEWTTEDWVKKLKQQAMDSREYRHKLYQHVDLTNCERVLDVGCGTGAITMDIAEHTKGDVIGIDIDDAKLEESMKSLSHLRNLSFQKADVQSLPFEDGTFDLVVFNIVLIYIPDKQRALDEMARVTRPGGYVLATMEPDYASKIDYPEDNPITPLMWRSLEGIGADLKTGRRLRSFFNTAGLKTTVGMDATDDFLLPHDNETNLQRFEEEFWVLEKLLKSDDWSDDQIEDYREEMTERIGNGTLFSLIPGFYAFGKKP